MAIQLTPPKKTPPKPKEKRKKKKKQLLAQKKRKQNQKIRFGSSNIGGFVGHTFDQQIDLDFDKSSDDSDEESEDETEKEAKRKEEEEEKEKEKERNMAGETDKQRIFRENRLEIIKLLCEQSKKYYGNNENEFETNGLNIFNRSGMNALAYAIRAQCYTNTNGYDINYGSVEIVNILIDMGCDVNIMNENAQTVVSLIFANTPTNILEILIPILNKADVNKELIIYKKADEDEDKMDMDDEKKDEKEIKIRRDSYLTSAIQALNNETKYHSYYHRVYSNHDPVKSTKYNVIKLLIEKGAKISVEKEIPAIIQIIAQCADEDIFKTKRFEYATNAGTEKNCIGYVLIELILNEYAQNVDLNVVDNPKNAYAKSLLLYVIDLIKKECQSLHSALRTQLNQVYANRNYSHYSYNYSGRDKGIRDSLLKIPLISERILYKLLSYNECRMEINEEIIAEA
eukprot:111943_1